MNFNGNGQQQQNEEGRPESLRDMLRAHIIEQRDFNKKIERLQVTVFGDQDAGIKGVVKELAEHRKWISWDKRIKIAGTSLAASGGTVWTFWEDAIKHFIFK